MGFNSAFKALMDQRKNYTVHKEAVYIIPNCDIFRFTGKYFQEVIPFTKIRDRNLHAVCT